MPDGRALRSKGHQQIGSVLETPTRSNLRYFTMSKRISNAVTEGNLVPDNSPPHGLPQNLTGQISVSEDAIWMTLPEPLASYEFLYLHEDDGRMHLSPTPQEGHVKCPVGEGGKVVFFRKISE